MEKIIGTELLAPAGSYSKFLTAIYYGADAVYIGGKNFSLRSFADNFSGEEMRRAIDYAHSLGKRVYVTANIFAKNADFKELEKYFKFLEEIKADSALISDPGVIYMAKNAAPSLTIHLSTQANATNKYAVKFWGEQGIKRVVLARELSLAEIKEIHEFVPDMELEAFVHGAMCISYSGRCLLSNYLDGRESNRGACVQACRWKYALRPIAPRAGEEYLVLQEDERGSYVMNSKDLNMIEHLNKMSESGVCSFKIEGRMKSEYYLATVINAYRRAIDSGDGKKFGGELFNTAHRDYTTAYMLGKNDGTVNYDDTQEKGNCEYIANVKGSDGEFVFAEMRNRFFKGDILEVLSPNESFGKRFIVQDFYNSSGEECSDGKLVQEIYKIRCPYRLNEGDILRRPAK